MLNLLMCGKISVDDLIAWLTADNMVILSEENLVLVGIILWK